jgi:hypothetical protein
VTIRLDVLYGYPGSDPPDLEAEDREARSNEVFERARLAYEAGDHAGAAHGFLSAAEAILWAPSDERPPDSELDKIMAMNRIFCYRNARSAFLMAGAPDEARTALLAAAAKDPDNANAIRGLVIELDQPH